LREDGLNVIGIGEAKTPQSLRNVCNRFILIENITAPSSAETDKKTPTAKPRPTAAEALPLFREAFQKIDSSDDWYQLGGVGSIILAAHPDFDPRTYGHGKLSSLVDAIKAIETKKTGNNLMIRSKT